MPTKHFLTRVFFIAGWCFLSSMGALSAQAEGVPEPPEIPPALVDGEAIEPEGTIIKKEEGTIYEYRVNGLLYMVKVQPVVGPAYYLVDRDGDGEFDSRSTDPDNISVPQWILLRW